MNKKQNKNVHKKLIVKHEMVFQVRRLDVRN